jgi:hypothetical protein
MQQSLRQAAWHGFLVLNDIPKEICHLGTWTIWIYPDILDIKQFWYLSWVSFGLSGELIRNGVHVWMSIWISKHILGYPVGDLLYQYIYILDIHAGYPYISMCSIQGISVHISTVTTFISNGYLRISTYISTCLRYPIWISIYIHL